MPFTVSSAAVSAILAVWSAVKSPTIRGSASIGIAVMPARIACSVF
jgi:hypothetical protein